MTELALQFIVSLEGQGWVTRAIEGKQFYTVILTRRLKKKERKRDLLICTLFYSESIMHFSGT